jgi:hypothetical protein
MRFTSLIAFAVAPARGSGLKNPDFSSLFPGKKTTYVGAPFPKREYYKSPEEAAGRLAHAPEDWKNIYPGENFEEYLGRYYHSLGPMKAQEHMKGSPETFKKYFPEEDFDETWKQFEAHMRDTYTSKDLRRLYPGADFEECSQEILSLIGSGEGSGPHGRLIL